jgi:hypothetical protein
MRKSLVHACVLLLLGASVVTAIALGFERPSPAVSLGHAEYLYDFRSLDEMVATSAAVVEATVLTVEKGPVLGGETTDEDEASGGPGSDGAVEYMSVTLGVDEVFVGSLEVGKPVTLLELPTVELPLTPDGSHGFFFLYFDKTYTVHTLIGPEGRFLVGEGGKVSSTSPPKDWITALEQQSVDDFRASLKAAVSTVEIRSVEPAEPRVGGK